MDKIEEIIDILIEIQKECEERLLCTDCPLKKDGRCVLNNPNNWYLKGVIHGN